MTMISGFCRKSLAKAIRCRSPPDSALVEIGLLVRDCRLHVAAAPASIERRAPLARCSSRSGGVRIGRALHAAFRAACTGAAGTNATRAPAGKADLSPAPHGQRPATARTSVLLPVPDSPAKKNAPRPVAMRNSASSTTTLPLRCISDTQSNQIAVVRAGAHGEPCAGVDDRRKSRVRRGLRPGVPRGVRKRAIAR